MGTGAEPAPWVVIHHTDCDSVLSSAMLMGYLPPEPALVNASVCADHTGEENDVADLLQALDEERHGDRTEAQYLASLHHVRRLLAGEDPEPDAGAALARRRAARAAARRFVTEGQVRVADALAVGQLDRELDGAFFPALLPDAAVILLTVPHPARPGRWTVRLRVGVAAPSGFTLDALRVGDWDRAFGGRWNAGSNKRGGGTAVPPDAYAERVRARLRVVLA
jgi:hypothetical protein